VAALAVLHNTRLQLPRPCQTQPRLAHVAQNRATPGGKRSRAHRVLGGAQTSAPGGAPFPALPNARLQLRQEIKRGRAALVRTRSRTSRTSEWATCTRESNSKPHDRGASTTGSRPGAGVTGGGNGAGPPRPPSTQVTTCPRTGRIRTLTKTATRPTGTAPANRSVLAMWERL